MKIKISAIAFLLTSMIPLCHADDNGNVFVVSECNTDTKKCSEPVDVKSKWPDFQSPFNKEIDGGYVDNYVSPSSLFIISGTHMGNVLKNSSSVDLIDNDFYRDFMKAPEVLWQGADALLGIKPGNILFFKGDKVFEYISRQWKPEQNLTSYYSGLKNTVFEKGFGATVNIPGTNWKKAYVFSGGYVGILDLDAKHLEGTPKVTTEYFSGLWSGHYSIKGAFYNGTGKQIYLFANIDKGQ